MTDDRIVLFIVLYHLVTRLDEQGHDLHRDTLYLILEQ